MEIEEEEWIEHIRRSTREAEEQMIKAKIPCWIQTHRRIKWRSAMRKESLFDERWSKKISAWNPGLDSNVKTIRPVGRRKKWEDEVNQFVKTEESEESKGNDLKNNDRWIRQANKQEEWNMRRRILKKRNAAAANDPMSGELKQTQIKEHSVLSPTPLLLLQMMSIGPGC